MYFQKCIVTRNSCEYCFWKLWALLGLSGCLCVEIHFLFIWFATAHHSHLYMLSNMVQKSVCVWKPPDYHKATSAYDLSNQRRYKVWQQKQSINCRLPLKETKPQQVAAFTAKEMQDRTVIWMVKAKPSERMPYARKQGWKHTCSWKTDPWVRGLPCYSDLNVASILNRHISLHQWPIQQISPHPSGDHCSCVTSKYRPPEIQIIEVVLSAWLFAVLHYGVIIAFIYIAPK